MSEKMNVAFVVVMDSDKTRSLESRIREFVDRIVYVKKAPIGVKLIVQDVYVLDKEGEFDGTFK
jgi:hypothetical protein